MTERSYLACRTLINLYPRYRTHVTDKFISPIQNQCNWYIAHKIDTPVFHLIKENPLKHPLNLSPSEGKHQKNLPSLSKRFSWIHWSTFSRNIINIQGNKALYHEYPLLSIGKSKVKWMKIVNENWENPRFDPMSHLHLAHSFNLMPGVHEFRLPDFLLWCCYAFWNLYSPFCWARKIAGTITHRPMY